MLTAEVLLPLTYLPRAHFLGVVFRTAHGAIDACAQVANELEQAEIILLPDESRLSADGIIVQPDGAVVSPSCHVLLEAKGTGRSSFQPQQLAREYVALLKDAGD